MEETEQEDKPLPTSRICIKNLPKHVDAARLREHFAARGEVTDAKVQQESSGRSRQLAFVGFKTVEQAIEAVRFYNHTFLDTSRIEVEFAKPYGSKELPRPWSKYSEGSSKHDKKEAKPVKEEAVPLKAREAKKLARAKKLAKAAQKEPEEMDPELAEFMALMQPRSKQKLWADGNADTGEGKRAAPGPGGAAGKPRAGANAGDDSDADGAASSDEDEYQDLASSAKGATAKEKISAAAAAAAAAAVSGKGAKKAPNGNKGKKKSAAGSDDDDDDDDVFGFLDDTADEDAEAGGGDGSEEDAKEEEAEEKNLGVSDLDYIRQRTRAKFSDSESDSEAEADDAEMEDGEEVGDGEPGTASGDDDGEDGEAEAEAGEDGEGAAAGGAGAGRAGEEEETDVSVTGRIFCRNLPFTATEDEIREFFAPFGELKAVHVVLDRITKQSKGLAFVEFADTADAVTALAQLDGNFFQGRLLHLLPGKAPPQVATVEEVAGAEGFKAAKDAKLRAGAGDRKIWSSLFVRADTVAEAVAARFGVSKSDVMDPGNSDVAARLALGEAQVISDTKRELATAGVDVAALEAAAARLGPAGPRSNSVILLKNLQFATTEDEIRGLTDRFGPLGRLVLPASKALAVVEYLEPADARRAFAGLAYKKFHSVPLYVEWAPVGLLQGPAPTAPQKKAAGKQAKATGEDLVGADTDAQAADPEDDEGRILYVKNLAWATMDAGLKKHFEAAAKGSIRSATVSKRPGKTPGAAPLSAGFGFVEFSSAKAAQAAMAKLQGVALDGHALKLAVSRATPGRATSSRGGDAADVGTDRKSKKASGLSDTKIIVRNVAFEATKKDLKTLFAPFGQLKSLRQPRKFDGQHRGFAFVEMTTKAEAKAAFEALSQTHLYGRHLVLEWAKEGEGIEELRAKTAAQYAAGEAAAMSGAGGGAGSTGKRKQRGGEDVEDDY